MKKLRIRYKKNLLIFVSVMLLILSIPSYTNAATNCPAPAEYSALAKEYIEFYNIPLTDSKGRALNEKFLLNQSNIGSNVIVYGCPSDIDPETQDLKKGQYRFLGWDYEGNLYRNWMFESDSNVTKSVAKNWVKEPWKTTTGRAKNIEPTLLSKHPDAIAWLTEMKDPYGYSKTFLESYNKLKGTSWTGETLLDYVIIQQARTKFSPGVVQMWNIWQPDGSWWYEIFTIPAEQLAPPPEKPDLLIIDPLVVQSDAWVGDSVPVKITTKNQGKENSGPFTVGILGTSIKSEVISNVPPGAIKTVTINVTSSTSGIKKFTAMTDFGLAVTESKEDNNTKPFQIAFNKKNEPTTPVAIISHLEGDHRTKPALNIKPLDDPKLDDLLSYSPGKEAITVREWKFKTPAGVTYNKKPAAKDFSAEGDYLVELRVTNSANKVSEWAELIIHAAAEPLEPPPTPSTPDLKADIEFQPPVIVAGETSSLINHSDGLTGYTWKFSDNLTQVLPNNTNFEFINTTYLDPGNYSAEFTATDGVGSKRDTAVLQVIDPKPVAVVAGITRVIQGRDLAYPHHLLNSYTPLENRGVTIDFSKSETRYKKLTDASYTDGWFTNAPADLGEYSIEGKVYDSTGRVSDWGTLILEVIPDAPPTIEVIAPEEAYRNNGFMLYIDAESPDGDILKTLIIEERYDQDGDGNFDEESWIKLYEGDFKTTNALNYNKVGKRQYRASVTEDYGMQGNSGIASTDILNYAPEVNFNAFGVTQQPGQGEDSGPPVTNYTSSSIFRSWTLKKPYMGGSGDKLGWKADTTTIATKNAVMANFAVGYPNSGNGPNSRTKFQLASDIVGKPTWKLTNGSLIKTVFAGSRLYSYSQTYAAPTRTFHFTEHNAVTGEILRTFSIVTDDVLTFLNVGPDETFYFSDRTNYPSNLDLVKIAAYDKYGVRKDEISFYRSAGSQDAIGTNITFTEISPDGQSMYIGYRQAYGVTDTWGDFSMELRFYKYSLKDKYLVWEVSGEREYRGYYSNINMTYGTKGDVYFTYNFQDRYANSLQSLRGYITQVRANGVKSTVNLGGAAGLSHASVSDDGNYVFVNYVQLSNSDEYANVLLHAIQSSTYSDGSPYFQTAYARSVVTSQDDWGHGYSEVALNANPLIFSDTNIYSQGRVVSSYNLFFNRWGNQIGTWVNAGASANVGKIFANSNSEIIFPVFNPVGLTSYSDFNAPRKVTATLYNATKLSAITSSPEIGLTPVTWQEYAADYATPILPDGSLFVFYDRYVMPFVSASGTGGLKGINADTVEILNDDWGGLLYDAGSIMKNYALEFSASINDAKNAKIIGAGFQIQNEKNMYAMEWSKDTLSLYRVVNGAKTLLKSAPMTRNAFTTYPVKVESVNGIQRVYVNHSKVLEVADSTYLKGSAGLMSLGQPNTAFSNVKKTNYGDTFTEETYESVLVNDPIFYDKLFKDVENDPMGTEEWSYSHNPNFFENPEGLSTFSGKTFGATVNALEKAGVYEITFRAEDNPGLSAYRKWSEPVKKLLYVHRRPVAQPDVRFTGKVFAEGESLDYETYDTSYDPDIAHFLSDKVFRTRWSDESAWTAGKRQYYNRPGVELIVQEQVRDIHGAWSYWGQYIVYKDALPAVNQTKPVMTITYPSGTTAAAPTVLATEPAITWTYFDAEKDPQDMFRLSLNYANTNELALYLELEGSAMNYTMLKGSIIPGRVVKVQGQVYSAGVWSDLSNIRFFVLDLPPETHLLTFNGNDAANPIFTNRNRPQLRTFTVDPENHPIAAIDYEVFQGSNGAKVIDTNSATASASYTSAALAEGLHYWRARANDSYLWGPYSDNGFFFVDTVKPADVDEKLEIEPTAVTVKFNGFSDVAPSSGHATRTFYLQKVNANGSVTNIDLNGDGTAEYSTSLALNRQSYRVAGLIPGQEYRLTVLDYDIAGNEGHFTYIYFVTNRPPTADFDWSPKPLYEEDTATFLSDVDDPDGDTLSIKYEITSPAGEKSSFSYMLDAPDYPPRGPILRMVRAGTWTMQMTVSDDIAEPVIVTKTVQVLPLTVIGYVKHTELWDQHRKDFNTKKSGNADSPRGYSVFWAGEKFMLEADTTVTGTTTRAERVEVQMDTYSSTLVAINTAHTKWKGEMWDADFGQLAKGKITFTFTAYYNNGAIKIDTVDVSVDGQTLEIAGVHRVQ
ncbi:CARDB protein [Paenibacillus prosopidis]|uniref:CARDB protein n=2 Tax=Paenibacillus prosopidis TaxID=630520 RepID=A0A368W3Y9_9BACL|nr:CARDB protein [Paenibacillus prosopidis]